MAASLSPILASSSPSSSGLRHTHLDRACPDHVIYASEWQARTLALGALQIAAHRWHVMRTRSGNAASREWRREYRLARKLAEDLFLVMAGGEFSSDKRKRFVRALSAAKRALAGG